MITTAIATAFQIYASVRVGILIFKTTNNILKKIKSSKENKVAKE